MPMTGSRRIAYQLVAPLEKTIGIAEIDRRRDYLQHHAAVGIEIVVLSVPSGYPSIESERDAVVVAPHVLAGLTKAEAEGASAGIIGCFSDPAIDAVRETVKMPVVGAGQSAIALALQLGQRYAILSPLDSSAKRATRRVRGQGLAGRLASVRGVGVSVVDLARGTNDAWERIVATGRRCIDEDDADVLVMGCMSMAFMGVERELSQRLGAPVVSPVLAALKTAETLLDLGIAHARTAWPSPPDKPFIT
jgi:allantoin racemase